MSAWSLRAAGASAKVARGSANSSPALKFTQTHRRLLERRDIEVVDVTTHPCDRVQIVEDAIAERKHILSQKPFALELSIGRSLVEKAASAGVKLAVNQNGRWAPHFSYLKRAVEAGLIGKLSSAHFSVHWDHSWIAKTRFDEMKHLVLFDFAIHWFDIIVYLFGERRACWVSASVSRADGQIVKPPMLAQAIVGYDNAQASLVFNGNVKYGREDQTYLAGTSGSLISRGPSLSDQRVTLHTSGGVASPVLKGTWFREGFIGAMSELLCAIEEEREPANSARGNLESLALCFAAVASAELHTPQIPGEVVRLSEAAQA
ncbi:MAG: Gfo/Idh/MocA family oxidoreductase [Pyrinomonadaceae bacterium]